MLFGKVITLRPVLESDLPQLYAYQTDLTNRGDFWGLNFRTLPDLRKEVVEEGMWTEEWGALMIIDIESQKLLGHIHWFKTVQYMDEIEIGYILYDVSRRRRGAMTEALKMFTAYLFDIKPHSNRAVNRIRLTIATDNIASRRVAEKAGYTHEATMRGTVYNRGRFLDQELYSMIRSDLRPA